MELRELLEIGPGLTALIGGGGKTTLMYHLASELRQQGTVLVCTTTKIWPPAHLRVCTEEGTLREELRRRKLPRELWDAALDELPEQSDTVERLLMQKLRGRAPEGAELRRACAALIRRGFSWEEVSSAAKRLSHGLELDE